MTKDQVLYHRPTACGYANDRVEVAMWRKARASNDAGYCVEVAFAEDSEVWVRDSKDPDGPVLTFTLPEWDAFLAGILNGEFTLEALAKTVAEV